MSLQYSDTSTYQGLLQDTAFLLGSNSGVLPDDYSANDYKRNANQWYRKAINEVIKTVVGWQFKDTIATTNLVASTKAYQFSAGAGLNIAAKSLLRITRVEVSYDNGANYYKAEPITYAELQASNAAIADSDFETNAGLNSTTQPYYVLRDDYIDIYPVPTSNSTNGLKIYYTADVSDLSNTTDIPDLVSLFHRYISLGAAYDYAFSRGLPNAGALRQEVEIYGNDIRVFLSDRNEDQKYRTAPANLIQYEN